MGTKERKLREKNDRIQSIIQNSIKLINSKNVSVFTMEELAQKTELSRATVYSYFNNRYEILLYIIIKEYLKLSQILLLIPEDMDDLKRVDDLVSAIIRFHRNNSIGIKIAIYLYNTIDIKKVIKDKNLFEDYLKSRSAVIDLIKNSISKGQINNLIRSDIEPSELAFILINSLATFFNLILNKFFHDTTENLFGLNIDTICEDYKKLIIDSLKAKVD